jgi:hypothetical protein
MVHNHPSGDPTPSQADIAVTQDIKKAAARSVWYYTTTSSSAATATPVCASSGRSSRCAPPAPRHALPACRLRLTFC